MSEQFEMGLRDLYAAAEMSHAAAQPGLAVGLMISRTRRNRRARAAAVTMATAAAVVGVAVAGTAVVRNMDPAPAPPADAPTATDATTAEPITGTVTDPACGTALDQLARVPESTGIALQLGLDSTELTAGTLTGWLGTTFAAGGDGFNAEVPAGYGFVVAQGGIVVGTSQAELVTTQRALPATHDATITPGSCHGGTLEPGSYDLLAVLPSTLEVDGTQRAAVLVSEPTTFTVPEPAPLRPAEEHGSPDGVSATPPADTAAALPDGDYLAVVNDVDAVAGTLSADVKVLYFGQAAQDWVSANTPGTEVYDDYVTDDPDGPTERTLALGDAPVWEMCSSDGSLDLVQRTGGVAEWAVAPIEDGESLCSDTSTVPRAGLYWLDVRGGVVMQVVAQYLP